MDEDRIITAMNTGFGKIENRLDNLESEYSKTRRDIGGLSTRLKGLEDEVSNLKESGQGILSVETHESSMDSISEPSYEDAPDIGPTSIRLYGF